MHLKRILLRHFRNYSEARVFFSPSINFIQGKNGQGKTNLLEAIYLISTGRSFRTHNLSDLISFGQKFFYLEAEFEKDGVSQIIMDAKSNMREPPIQLFIRYWGSSPLFY